MDLKSVEYAAYTLTDLLTALKAARLQCIGRQHIKGLSVSGTSL